MKTKKLFLLFALIIILLAPWLHTKSGITSPPEIRQENNSFYETNSCQVSLINFLRSNPKAIYQDHYFFRPENKTSISCFGKIFSVSVLEKNLETQFYIYIGTNSFISLIIQSLFWIIVFSFIKKDSNSNLIILKANLKWITLFVSAYFFTYSIYAESRFYESSFYIFDFINFRSYILIFLIFIFIILNTIDILHIRIKNLINYLPFIYLFSGIYSGYNLTVFSILFFYFGLYSILEGKNKNTLIKIYLILSIWWLVNSDGNFYFNVGKLRGFTSSSFDFNSNLYWIVFFPIFILGIYEVFNFSKEYFDLSKFSKNISIASFSMIIIGILGSNFPIFNYFTYYYLGFQRYVIESQNPIAIDQYSERISWRGVFSSSETVGEFYGFCLIIILFQIMQSKKNRTIDKLGILSAGLGLYFSDNKTVIILTFLIIIYYLVIQNFNVSKKNLLLFLTIFSTLTIILLLTILGSSNYLASFEFTSNSIVSQAENYQFENIYSSSYLYIKSSIEKQNFFSFIFKLFSSLSFLLNRSEMWGLFIAKYNPSFLEVFFGSGPQSFGQLYGEIPIKSPDSLFLPHSSLLSYLLFFGFIPLVTVVGYFLTQLFLKKNFVEYKIIIVFLLINLLKNDSINYSSAFIFYFFLVLLSAKNVIKSEKILKSEIKN